MRRHKPDYYIVLFMAILLVVGLLLIYSVGPALSHLVIGDYSQNYFLYRQLFNIAVGLGGFTFAALLPSSSWKKLLPIILAGAILTNLLLLIPGLSVSQNGATRWLAIGPFSFQPVELLKLAVVIYFAKLLSSKNDAQLADKSEIMWPAAIILAVIGLVVVFLQRDMGTMLVLAAIIIGMLYAAGVKMSQMAILTGAFGALGVLSVVLFPHRIARFLTFLNPGSDLEGSGYHVQQVLIAIGSGGLMGLGLGKSIQSYGYVPESANDSIFAIYAEKFGFIGSLVLFTLFILLLSRIFRTAMRCEDKFQRYLVVGVLLWLSSHIIINIGAMLALVPLTGITLPFLSYGGTSLLFIMTAIGIAYQASRFSTHQANASGLRTQTYSHRPKRSPR